MKNDVSANTLLNLGIIAAALVALVLLWSKLSAFFSSKDNIINRGAESLYTAVTGSKDSPGTDLYEATHKPGTTEPTFVGYVLDRFANVKRSKTGVFAELDTDYRITALNDPRIYFDVPAGYGWAVPFEKKLSAVSVVTCTRLVKL